MTIKITDNHEDCIKRIKHLETVCMVAGFLLNKVNLLFVMSYGMQEQVLQCIKDCDEIVETRGKL